MISHLRNSFQQPTILEITILPFHQRLRARQHQFHGQTCKGLHEGKSLSHHSRGNVASSPGSVCTLPPHPFRCCHYVQDMNKGTIQRHAYLVGVESLESLAGRRSALRPLRGDGPRRGAISGDRDRLLDDLKRSCLGERDRDRDRNLRPDSLKSLGPRRDESLLSLGGEERCLRRSSKKPRS